MHKFFSVVNKVLTILVVITMTGQSVVQAQLPQQDGKPRIDYSDSTGKVVFIGADANAPIVVRAARDPGLSHSESALAMVSQYETDFGLRNAESELQLLSANQVGSRNVTRFQQVYQGIPVIAGEMVVNATSSDGLLSLSGEISPDLNIDIKPTITPQQAIKTATELMRKAYDLNSAEITFSVPELWIYDSRLLQPDGTAPALVWKIEAQANNNLPVNEFILIDATRGHIALNFNQVDTAWNHTGAGKVENEDVPQTTTPTPTPIVPTSTPEAPQTPTSDASTPQTDPQPTAPLPVEKPDTTQPDKTTPQPQLGVTYYVDIAAGNNSNSCTAPASPCKDIQETINKAGTGDIIRIASGVYTLSTNPSPNVVINNGKDLTLSGGWNSGFTLQSGVSTVDGQNANNGYLHTGGTVTIENFIIQSSTSSDSGAIYMVGGTLTLKRSTLKNNSANRGSGIFMAGSGTLTVENSTISGNTATTSGAGMYLANGTGALVTIRNSTISNNASTGSGGGITQANSASITLTNSIVANNTASSNPDCNGTLSNASYNIIENATGCTITSGSNNSNVDPLLSASLSGTFQVHTPQTGSPAINGGTNTGCPSVDQLGNLRPQGAVCDMGAVEIGQNTIFVLSGNNQFSAVNTAFSAPISVIVRNTVNQPVSGVNVTFTAPNSGASATFSVTGTNTTIVTTDANGVATTSSITANNSSGSYTVIASAAGYSSANLQMTNTLGDPNGRYVSTTGSDTSNTCNSPATPCQTINWAISQATAGNTIYVAEGTYYGSGAEVVSINNKSITLLGGWNPTFTTKIGYSTIDGQGARRGITNTSFTGPTVSYVTIEYFVVQNGYHNSQGGGIHNSGSQLILNNSRIVNNLSDWMGGGIYNNGGGVTINASSISENTTGKLYASGGGGGGGIQNTNNGTVTINNSSISNNMILGGFSGSGIYTTGVILLNNSTISNNTGGSGEGIYSFGGTITLNNSTISGNQSYGFKIQAGSVTLKNTIISGNGGISDCYNDTSYSGTVTSQGYNLITNPQGCGFTAITGDIVNVDPKLGSLIGFPEFIPLLSGSPAINAGSPLTPGSGGNACLATDQRGITRPQSSRCDIGAVEFATGGTIPAYIVNYQGSPQSIWISTPTSVKFGVFVMDAEGKAVANATVTFTAPASGASGKFANNTTSTTVQTDSNGVALASTFTANAISGIYSVTATVQGLAANTSFALSNIDININTYTLNQTTSPLPGQFLCGTNNLACTNGANLDADKAHIFAYGTYNFYKNHHGRQGIDNAKMDIISSVDYGSGYPNAYWSGTQMVYGDGYSLADDVVAHELTHGVTQYESNLFYYYQSGAINESLSDIWGELYDQENGLGNDTSGAKWLMGEDLPIGAIRSMSNPPAYSDPDKMTSPYYNTTSSDDGGVHTNNGINNKAVYLMVDGGTFNGKTVTALGANKTLAIYYEVQTNLLSSGADYGDLYNLLYQACINLVNGPDGITAADCQEVRDATDAVEMNLQPIANFNTDAPLCGPSQTLIPVYQDGFESGLGSWTINNGSTPRWQLDSPYGPFAHSGSHFLYGNDYPQSGVVADATAMWSSKLIPAGAYLHFAHAYDFETNLAGTNNYDGGVLEYSTNGGASWFDAGPLIDSNGYKGVIYPDYINPLAGRYAFVGTSHGYTSTRVNLASLAGQNVSFRWRMGLDDLVFRWGWWVDDVQVYTCSNGVAISGSTGASGVVLSYTNGTPKTATSDANGNYSFNVPIGWSGTVTPSHACYTFSPVSRTYSSLSTAQSNQNYSSTFTAVNGCASTNITIGGVNRGTYNIAPGNSQRVNYTGLDAGPVVVDATNDVPIIAALRDAYYVNGQVESFVQLMGLPEAQISTKYYFPAYNNVTLDGQLRFGNVGNSNTTVTVTIAGVVRGTYDLTPGQAKRVNYTGLDAGPVIVESSGGVPIIAALRDAYFVNGQIESFAQLMGLPSSQLSDTYYFPAYNNVTLNEQLRIGNVDTVPTTVTVTIAGVVRGTYPLDPNEAVRINYAGLDAGPVVVQSSGGAKIIAALRDAYFVNGQVTSFVQLMGLPLGQLSTKYYFPAYNNVTLDGQLRFGNVGNSNTTVTVTIGGVVRGTYNLTPGQAQRVNYTGLDAGPVIIESSGGVPIIAALRDAYFVNGLLESFAQLMGLPDTALSPTYYFPAYNNVTLNGQLRFGVP